MRRVLLSLVLLPLAAVSAKAQNGSAFPGAEAFAPGSGRVWFSGCVLEADRYIACKSAAQGVLEVISNPGGQTPGEVLQMFVSDTFIEKGCAFEAPPDSFRVNGIFLSFDTKAAKDIRCKGKASAVSFAPQGMALLDTLYFFSGNPPQ